MSSCIIDDTTPRGRAGKTSFNVLSEKETEDLLKSVETESKAES